MKDDAKENFINSLYADYYVQLVAYCTALLDGDESEAILCVQETLGQALKDAEKLSKHSNLVGWLKKTAVNRVKRVIRKKQKKANHEVHITDLSEKYLESLSYIQEYDEDFSALYDPQSDVEKVMAQLNIEERELYELRFVQKLTFKEISKRIAVSESATRMRTVRLELHIKEIVTKMFE